MVFLEDPSKSSRQKEFKGIYTPPKTNSSWESKGTLPPGNKALLRDY